MRECPGERPTCRLTPGDRSHYPLRPVSTDPQHRRAILHIGLPKCGSSALQTRLAASTSRLLDHGAFYPIHRPAGPRSVSMGHMALANELARRGPSPMLADILGQFDRSGARTLILSSEGFAARLRRVDASTTAPLLPFDLDVVLFTRRADASVISSFKHLVRRNRHTGEFAELVAANEHADTRLQVMTLPNILDEARRLFPEARLHLFDLDAGSGDSISRFSDLAGLPLTDWSNAPRPETKSRNAVLMRAGRAINESHSDEKTLYLLACNRSPLPDDVVAKVDYALLFVPDLAPDPRRLLSASESARLLDAAHDWNRAVEERFGFALAHHPPMAIPDEARTALTRDEAAAITRALEPHLAPELIAQLRTLTF